MNKRKLNFLKYILVLSFILGINFKAHAKFQVGTLAFVSQKTGVAGLTFLLQSGSAFRYLSSFSIGTVNTMQGEFSLGGMYYPLDSLTKSFAQPFIGVGYSIGLGQKDPSSLHLGHYYAVGVDLRFFKKYGLSIKVDNFPSTDPTDQRLGIGFYYKM